MDAVPLDYGRPRRRVPRAVVLVALATLVAWGAWRFAAPGSRYLSLAYHARQARQAFRACQQVPLPPDMVLYADRGSTPRLAPADVHRIGHAGWMPPPPDIPPRVAKPPAAWLNLGRHVRAAASLDRRSGTFTASAAAGLPEVMLQPDEAVLFVGNPQGPPADPNALQQIVTLTATPHELRWTFSAQQHLASTKKPGELSFTHPNTHALRIRIVRRDPTDRLEWMAAKLEAPSVLVAPYRLNDHTGQLTITLSRFAFEADATDGWVTASALSPPQPVWYLGSPDVSFVRVAPAWEEVKLRPGLQPHALAFDPATHHLIGIALVRAKRTRVEAWRVKGEGAPVLLAAAQLNRPSDYVQGLVSADARRFAAVMFDQARVFDVTSGRLLAICDLPPRRPWDLPHVGLSEDGRLLVGLAADGDTMSWWDVDRGREIAGMRIDGERISAAHQATVQVIGQRTFAFTRPHRSTDLTVIDTPWAMPRSIAGHRPFYAHTVSPCGRWIAGNGVVDQQIRTAGMTIYDWQSGATLLGCSEIGEHVRAAVWSADGRRVAAHSGHHVFVYDLPSRSMMRARKPRLSISKQPLALSPDGSRLAIASEESSSVYCVSLPPRPILKAPTPSSTRNPS
ncbi:MAG TPA: WD40 repeat domain-containing protein [Tepidisphaeraceae bacterium]|nr:WD40 repeat domain-containing protein [Tepidisphaeraceae bacterium]